MREAVGVAQTVGNAGEFSRCAWPGIEPCPCTASVWRQDRRRRGVERLRVCVDHAETPLPPLPESPAAQLGQAILERVGAAEGELTLLDLVDELQADRAEVGAAVAGLGLRTMGGRLWLPQGERKTLTGKALWPAPERPPPQRRRRRKTPQHTEADMARTGKRVLDHLEQVGQASTAQIAEATGLQRRAVNGALQGYRRSGRVRRTRKNGWELAVAPPQPPETAKADPEPQAATQQPATEAARPVVPKRPAPRTPPTTLPKRPQGQTRAMVSQVLRNAGRPMACREIAQEVGVTDFTIRYHCEKLAAAGDVVADRDARAVRYIWAGTAAPAESTEAAEPAAAETTPPPDAPAATESESADPAPAPGEAATDKPPALPAPALPAHRSLRTWAGHLAQLDQVLARRRGELRERLAALLIEVAETRGALDALDREHATFQTGAADA